jgi:hypothetical protein
MKLSFTSAAASASESATPLPTPHERVVPPILLDEDYDAEIDMNMPVGRDVEMGT